MALYLTLIISIFHEIETSYPSHYIPHFRSDIFIQSSLITAIINKNLTSIVRNRTTSESQNSVYAEQETDELIAMLRETESLDEQGDILQYLVDTHGLDFSTGELVTSQTFTS